jgi:hypothetical protein
MARYAVGVRSANTAATADNAAAVLWNPSGTRPIKLLEVWLSKTVSTADNQALVRVTARGTQSTTVTPDADNCFDDTKIAPASGAVVDTAWSAQPTVAAPYIARTNLPAAVGSGFIWVLSVPWTVKPGEGIAIVTPVATILQASDITFVFED